MYTSSDFFIPGVTRLAGTSAGTTLPTTPNFRIQGDNQLFGLAQIPEGAMDLKMNMAAAIMADARRHPRTCPAAWCRNGSVASRQRPSTSARR